MVDFIKNFFDIKFWKFILVGIINTIVGLGLQFVFYNVFGWDAYAWGVIVATLLGNVFGSLCSYFLNKYFTFKNKEKGWKPVLRFALNIACCYVVAYVIVAPVAEWIFNANPILFCPACSEKIDAAAKVCASCGKSTEGALSFFGWSVEKFAGNAAMTIGACVFVACNYVGQRFFAFKERGEE
ncbi:MAG: GtrA family protein [Ruminococcus sp.]|nr:GtrA family protein [Ruminococcus sp.]